MTTSLPSLCPETPAASGGPTPHGAAPSVDAPGAFGAVFAAPPAGAFAAVLGAARGGSSANAGLPLKDGCVADALITGIANPAARVVAATDAVEIAPDVPSREELEAALALLAPLWSALAPDVSAGTSAQPSSRPPASGRNEFAGSTGAGAAPVTPAAAGDGVDSSPRAASTARVVVTAAGFAPIEFAPERTPSAAAVAAEIAARWATEPAARPGTRLPSATTSSPVPSSSSPLPTPPVPTGSSLAGPNHDSVLRSLGLGVCAVDSTGASAGARLPRLRMEMVEPQGLHVTVEVDGADEPSVAASGPAVTMPSSRSGSTVIAARSAASPVATPSATMVRDELLPAPANSAARTARETGGSGFAPAAAEKNSLNTRAPSVKLARSEAGISGAQSAGAMPELASAPSVFVAAPAAEAVPAVQAAPAMAVAPMLSAVDATSLAPATAPTRDQATALAHRAVEAVESVVDAQIAARLQPAPGVSLRFRVGQEDLAVRIELRGGEVHTEFRTDSAELRHAVTTEWRAMSARADAPVRLVDPVFASHQDSPAGGQSFAQSQQHQSQHQHGQQQHALLRDVPVELFGRVGRRFPVQPAAAEASPLAPLAPATSRRLSAVA